MSTVVLDQASAIARAALIPPHGGELVLRIADQAQRRELELLARTLPSIAIDSRAAADLECIATGVYSPLTGFMGSRDYRSVIESMRLSSGLPWSIPVVLSISRTAARDLRRATTVTLANEGSPIAIMRADELFERDVQTEAELVYRTTDPAHPGVAALTTAGEMCLAGEITLLQPFAHEDFLDYRLTPTQTRAIFAERGWRTIVAFQTRNPIHRAHEYLQKVALEMVDGLFVNPLVGTTKGDDVPADVRMRTYEVILKSYYPAERTLLGVFPAAMRYAGPREAIMHAIARKNYGCTHFIVGRDHAGVGNYYGTYDAQEIFDAYDPGELGIVPLKFEHAHFCLSCGQLVTSKTCPHGQESWVHLSGTKVRAMLSAGELPPPEFTRPEVAQILIDAYARAS
jgi:sulfate adenylyltransferase